MICSNKARYRDSWTREHILPVSKGGGNGTNVVLAHWRCNTNRGNSDPTPEMVRRARRIWWAALALDKSEIKRFTSDRTVNGTYAACYDWPK